MKILKQSIIFCLLSLPIFLQGSAHRDSQTQPKASEQHQNNIQLQQCAICLDEKNRNDFRRLLR